MKKTRYISSTPDRILDAPDLRNDFCKSPFSNDKIRKFLVFKVWFMFVSRLDLNLLDWSSHNILAVALHNSVYLWDATKGDITLLMRMEHEEEYICSLSWTKDGSYLAVGTSDCKVQVCLSDVNVCQMC